VLESDVRGCALPLAGTTSTSSAACPSTAAGSSGPRWSASEASVQYKLKGSTEARKRRRKGCPKKITGKEKPKKKHHSLTTIQLFFVHALLFPEVACTRVASITSVYCLFREVTLTPIESSAHCNCSPVFWMEFNSLYSS